MELREGGGVGDCGAGRQPSAVGAGLDRSAIALVIATCPRVDRLAPRLVRIESTLHLRELWVSEALWQSDGRARSSLRAVGEPCEMSFGPDGNLTDLPAPRAARGRAPWMD